jgi:hypothetical protein
MSFQLRRMVLVNAGTNKGRPSGLITEIDPRGGAAVVGANGVGKTTTLRLIPLFFGHPTSQVVALNQGQEGVRFILPSATSAICFEYQRGGEGPEALRLAVMRPRADADAPEYRIYPCGFRKDLFIRDGHFVTDEVSAASALAAGIAPTSKLNTPEYRSVILGSRSFTKEHRKLLAYAREHSFGPRELPNLDRLVATMVKNGVRFEDLVQVAVGLIEIERAGDQRQRLTFRQQRKQLEDWLRNLDAARGAVAAQPRVAALGSLCLAHNTLEREWRHLHHEVLVVMRARDHDRKQQQQRLDVSEGERRDAAKSEAAQLEQLETAARDAAQRAGRAKSAYETAHGEQQQFEQEEASRWAVRIEEIPAMEANRSNVDSRLAAALSSASEVHKRYREEEGNIHRVSADARAAAEARKKPLHEQFDREHQDIDAYERAALEELGTETSAKRAEIQGLIEPLHERLGQWRVEVQNPPRPAKLEQTLADARLRREGHAGEMRRHARHMHDAAQAAAGAQRTFERAEQSLALGRHRASEAREALALAQLQQRPADGTLLSALRAHSSEQWKADFARVIDPRLLHRTDLKPVSLSDDLAESLYGWQLDTSQIEPPPWSNDALLRQGVAEAQADVDAAAAKESELLGRLASASADFENADQQHTDAQAHESVLASREQTLKEAVDDAEAALHAALRAGRERAVTEVQEAEAKIRSLRGQLTALDTDHRERESEAKRSHAKRLDAARARRDDGLQAINGTIEQIDSDASQRVRELKAQEHEHLKAEGLDPEAVNALQAEADDLLGMIRELKLKQPLVANWRAWMAAGGEGRVANLMAEAQKSTRLLQDAARDAEQQRTAARDAQLAHDRVASESRKQVAKLDSDVQVLTGLPALFGDYIATPFEGVDLGQGTDALKQRVRAKLEQLRRSAQSIDSSFLSLHKDLTARESTTRELVEGHLADIATSNYARAMALVSACRRLETQVIPDIRNTLQTVLANIGSFHKSILGFETEVGAFNTRLQEALREVKRFERVDELHLNIVADFESLHFYKKLRHMDAVVREHQVSTASDRTGLPADSTAEALRDFLGVMGADGALEVNLGAHISLHGSVVENGKRKVFRRASELEAVSSTGLTSLILITLLVGLVNTVRRGDDVHVPWVTDEVGKFDPGNFSALMRMLADNRIDVITASPALDASQYSQFAHRYMFEDNGVVRICRPAQAPREVVA